MDSSAGSTLIAMVGVVMGWLPLAELSYRW
jgi:hypothetical protein